MKKTLLITILILLSACGSKKIDDSRNLNYIFKQYKIMTSELNAVDEKYVDYFNNLCTGDSLEKFDEADNIFEAVDDWEQLRNKIAIKYNSINFKEQDLTLKDFKEQFIIEELVSLTTNYWKAEDDINYKFLLNADCQSTSKKKGQDYKFPLVSKSCMINCGDIKNLAAQIKSLTQKENIIIQQAYQNLQEKNIQLTSE
ncbi:MAG: hypothetical protein AB1782_11105 [Cyanobacteriota bacterium]